MVIFSSEMKHRWFSAVSALCAFIVLVLLPLSGEADERKLQNEGKEHVDAVLLLDASGSMRRTDPLRLRDQGAKLFVQFLKPGDRLAIVEFSDTSKAIRPLSDYTSDQSATLDTEIAKVGNSGEYTDLLEGLRSARKILSESPRKEADQVIVLLSDGQMDPRPEIATADKRLSELKDEVLPGLRKEGVRVHSLSLSDYSDQKLLALIASETEGVSWHAPTADSIHQSFAELFLAVKKPQVLTMTEKGFPIDDGISEATFYINRSGTDEIGLTTPTGKKITAATTTGNISWYEGKKFDVITIRSPEIGNWKVLGLPSTDSFATVLTNLKLLADWPSGSVYSGDDVLLEARFYESRKPVSLPQLTGVVEYTYEVIPTDRVSEPIMRKPLVDDGHHGDRRANDGIFSALVSIDDVGEYKLTVTARAPTFVRQQQVPFRVKPRLVALALEGGDSHDSHGGDHGHDHGHGHGGDTSGEKFTLTLSEETAALKNVELKLRATDTHRKIFTLPINQVHGNRLRYEAPVHLLPEEGTYSVTATLNGDSKRRRKVRSASNTIEFVYTRGDAAPKVEVVEVVESKEEKPAGPPAVWPFILSLAVLNIGAGGGLLLMFKKTVSSISLAVKPYEPPADTIEIVEALKKKLEVSEVNFNDPMFLAENLERLENRTPLDLEGATPLPSEEGQSEEPAEEGEEADAAEEDAGAGDESSSEDSDVEETEETEEAEFEEADDSGDSSEGESEEGADDDAEAPEDEESKES